MARPLSEDKPVAVLRAASDVIAASGLGAPTSQIARSAGVAEGTLFRYFPSKDELLARLFDFLIAELEASLYSGLDRSSTAEAQTQTLWNNYIDWGLAQPAAYSTLNQLAVSGKITAEQVERASQMCAHVGTPSSQVPLAGLDLPQTVQFNDALFSAIANATIGLAATQPALQQAYKDAGFAALWRVLGPETTAK